jgi:5-oxoprolinase (ATP-hydrolysing) subunit A
MLASDVANGRASQAAGVAVGAHPGLPDLLGFGRRWIDVAPSDAREYILYQLGALAGFCRPWHLSCIA